MKILRPLARLATARRSLVLLASVVLGALAPAHGQLSVSASGTPSFSHAIEVPPGVAGMSPKIGLFYAGGGVNGPVGHGWSLQGLSVITRCAAIKATDGVRGAVSYTSSDKLCLDGQRLIQTYANGVALAFPQTGDSSGGAVREYRTEKDTYARIRAYGMVDGDTSGAKGPQYFKVWTKSGQIYEYGDFPGKDATTNALILAKRSFMMGPRTVTVAVPMAWAVGRISDTLGNSINFKYEQREQSWGSGPSASVKTPGREWNLLEIQYAGSRVHKVIFNYDRDGVRLDQSEAYHRGYKNISARLLSSISTYVNTGISGLGAGGTAVKTTKIEYEVGAVTKRKRVKAIQDCAGGPTSTRCMPATTFTYANGGDETYQANATFAASSLATTPLMNDTGTMGVVMGDFNGDGKTDFIRWSDTPEDNKLYLSLGEGAFEESPAFNIRDQNLFKNDGCYYSVIADFNADGLSDILRYSSDKKPSGGACVSSGPVLFYLNKGDGSFVKKDYLGPALERIVGVKIAGCLGGCEAYVATPPETAPLDTAISPVRFSFDGAGGWRRGATFFVMDVNGDGRPDIVTTELPDYDAAIGINPCSEVTCTLAYLGDGVGGFKVSPVIPTAASLYVTPSVLTGVGSPRNIVDANGDGISDIVGVRTNDFNIYTVFVAKGDGTFLGQADSGFICDIPLDFNGDGRSDCLVPGTSPGFAASNRLRIADGSGDLPNAGNFNLTHSGEELRPTDTVAVGAVIVDMNNDGRHDILRWHDDTTQSVVYLSNGDGTFTPSGTFNLKDAATKLRSWDSKTDFMLGDFTGQGNTEILRLRANPVAGVTDSNRLFVKTTSTPPDQLISVTSGAGAKTDLSYMSLSNVTDERYISDRFVADKAAVYPVLDVTFPMYVVTRSESDSGVDSARVATEYSYRGLKADIDGRGLLGFREVRRQSTGADGTKLTTFTQFMQQHPYTGVAAQSETRKGLVNDASAPLLSRTVNTYCDKSAGGSACSPSGKVQRPYLLTSVESGFDLNRAALPTVTTTNTFNDSGDPSLIVVSTTGTTSGISQTSTKTVNNQYVPDLTTDDNWILGRLSRATVTNTVPDLLTSLTTSPGTGTYATAIQGTGGASTGATISVTPPSWEFGIVEVHAEKELVVTNTGSVAASGIVYDAFSMDGSTLASYGVEPRTCAATLAPGASCALMVHYFRGDAGGNCGADFSGRLTVAGTNFTTVSVPLSGIPSTCVISPAPGEPK